MAKSPKAPQQTATTTDDPTQNLQKFDLLELAQFTREKAFSNNASKDFHLFFVGRDDVHAILKYVLSRIRVSLYLNMFGYDDDELNQIVMQKVLDPTVTVVITLDKSQSGGKHEKMLLDADRQQALAAFNSHFTIGQSLTHQISHTKGFVADGKVGAEGSTNWSDSGEGTAVRGQIGGPGYKAQNNTQTFFTDLDSIGRFQSELITEHLAARDQEASTPDNKRQKRPQLSQLAGIRKAGVKTNVNRLVTSTFGAGKARRAA
jgi:hypothetical protein